jgi:hypothetical protein
MRIYSARQTFSRRRSRPPSIVESSRSGEIGQFANRSSVSQSPRRARHR